MEMEPGQGGNASFAKTPAQKSGLAKLSPAQRTSILIGVMFIGALTWIYFRKSSIEQAKTEATIADKIQDAMIEQLAITSREQSGLVKFKDMLADAEQKQSDGQVMAASLKTADMFNHPFVRKKKPDGTGGSNGGGSATVRTPPDNGGETGADEKMPAPPALNGIIFGAVPKVFLNGRLLGTGQTIKGWKVMKIHKSKVEIEWKGKTGVVKKVLYTKKLVG